jgi:hypothetical protein
MVQNAHRSGKTPAIKIAAADLVVLSDRNPKGYMGQ